VEEVDEFDGGFGWMIADELMQRCSHALIVDDRAWLIDPIVGPRLEQLPDVAGVIQLLDRHGRDCVVVANRFGVPHHVVPEHRIGPFEFLPVRLTRHWCEVALWWPKQQVLACADALGTADYFRAGGERLGVHPLLRLRPPRLDVQPEVILCGHGRGVLDDAAAALREALRTSRRRIPKQAVSAVRAWARR
jgi:hypothetical protein